MKYFIDSLRFRLKSHPSGIGSNSHLNRIQLSFCNLRVLDTQLGENTILIIPDGPNVIEHYFYMLDDLKKDYRVIIFDLPGFGFSYHNGNYDFSFKKTNEILFELIEILNLKKVNIVFPCANGFYGLAFAQQYPELINHLMLLQTPSLGEMRKWTDRVVPTYLKTPYVGQLLMPFVEKKFAKKWYDYALPKEKDRKIYQDVALDAVKKGGSFCLCSLSQGLSAEENFQLTIDESVPATLIYGDSDFTHKTTDFSSIKSYHKGIDIIRFVKCGHFPDLEEKEKFIAVLHEKIN